MDVHAILLGSLSDFPILITFIATLLFGEEIVIILGFLSGLGLLPLKILFVFGFIGTFLSDLLWFIVGKTVFRERKPRGKVHKRYHKFMHYLNRVTHHNPFLALLLTRFFYLFRLFAIVHLSRRGMPAKKFLLYEIPIIIIWLIVFVAVGWFFGSTALRYLKIFGNFQIVFAVIAAILFAFFVLKSLISRFMEDKS